jgi:hypothetical protein
MLVKKEKTLLKEKPVLVNFKVTKEEYLEIWGNAKKYAGNNLSLWLRHAGINHKPR